MKNKKAEILWALLLIRRIQVAIIKYPVSASLVVIPSQVKGSVRRNSCSTAPLRTLEKFGICTDCKILASGLGEGSIYVKETGGVLLHHNLTSSNITRPDIPAIYTFSW